jgi:hypothetical protein
MGRRGGLAGHGERGAGGRADEGHRAAGRPDPDRRTTSIAAPPDRRCRRRGTPIAVEAKLIKCVHDGAIH